MGHLGNGSALFALAAVALSACGGGAGPPPAAPPPPDPYARCAGFEEKAASVWSPQIRGGLDFSVRIYNGEILAADAELAVNRLDEFTAAWVETATGACRRHADAGTLDGDDYGSLTACLDLALESQRVVIDAMKTGGKTAIAQAQTLPGSIKVCKGEAVDEAATTDMRDNPFGGKP